MFILTPIPAFPQGWGQHERWLTRQSGAFAKIAYKAIFIRSALPWGKMKGGKSLIKQSKFVT